MLSTLLRFVKSSWRVIRRTYAKACQHGPSCVRDCTLKNDEAKRKAYSTPAGLDAPYERLCRYRPIAAHAVADASTTRLTRAMNQICLRKSGPRRWMRDIVLDVGSRVSPKRHSLAKTEFLMKYHGNGDIAYGQIG